ncbi:hypothetical protein [Nocardioides endophyticus]|uniref:hypothetical protein n=1 Tax=Nocardioides endophyticus TaxID=1353775 RepID=UPI0031E5C615
MIVASTWAWAPRRPRVPATSRPTRGRHPWILLQDPSSAALAGRQVGDISEDCTVLCGDLLDPGCDPVARDSRGVAELAKDQFDVELVVDHSLALDVGVDWCLLGGDEASSHGNGVSAEGQRGDRAGAGSLVS